ncbi:hypothetical protein SUGI_0000870 [Cryptomeria japonica]|uniref:scarecrow-like protein 9 n=1 Tax=Cryptomeria japonica TaxID=3369 RepID=UPI0024089D19|nr:scarecrow-like protein 9 [Cryptomeria japonica]GLJ04663.1 hypothetical protein SUGI_0000870 [Cryptomeria japonica]
MRSHYLEEEEAALELNKVIRSFDPPTNYISNTIMAEKGGGKGFSSSNSYSNSNSNSNSNDSNSSGSIGNDPASTVAQEPWLPQQQGVVPFQEGSSSSSCSSEKATPLAADGESEDSELFSDIVLKYINDMLMNEDMEDRKCMYQECSALQATAKPFYDILGENYPPHPSEPSFSQNQLYNEGLGVDDIRNNGIEDRGFIGNLFDISRGLESPVSANFSTDYSSQLSFSSSGSSTVMDGFPESPIYEMSLPELFSETEQSFGSVSREVEDALYSYQLARENNVDREFNEAFYINQVMARENNLGARLGKERFWRVPKQESDFEFKLEKIEEGGSGGVGEGVGVTTQQNIGVHSDDANGSKQQRHKNPHREDLDLEDRQSNKHSAVFPEHVIRTEKFDEVLLCQGKNGRNFSVIQKEVLQNGVQKSPQDGSVKGGTQSGKSRGKKQGKKEVVDLRTLLVHCAQAVATDDNRGANEILKQIRQHASPHGDGSQRLAHYFVESLEARLSGTGGRLYTIVSSNRPSAAEILKAYHLYLAATPFKKISHFLSNQTILRLAENATRLHIVDFGVLYGFQWPCLIQNLANRPGGPPKLRITGIDFPQPGFRPAERIEETGRRLADYAKSFGVPFEYQAIAAKWENLDIADLNLRSDELLVVNCMYRLRNLMDETVIVESPRNIVLNKIRSMNPSLYIQGVVNGAYSAPFFITRFREALFHYSALFDALETTIPRDHPERICLEKELLGREILNVVACEGLERVERPETYKQWQVRTKRAGFVQLPLNRSIFSKAREKLKSLYHKDFGVDEDGNWLLLGWKGRIIMAISTWRP